MQDVAPKGFAANSKHFGEGGEVDGKRLEWIDIAKGVAIMAVVLGHSYQFGNPIHAFVYSFHIPLFFMLAGYTSRVKPLHDVAVSSCKRLLLPYAALCLFLIVVGLLDPVISLSDVPSMLAGMVFGGSDASIPFGFPGVGLAWFLIALSTARILFNVLVGFFEKRNVSEILRFVVFAVLACLAWVMSSRISLPFALNQAFVALFFMYVGFWLKEKGAVRYLSKWWVVTVCVAAWLVPLCCGVFFSIGNMFFLGTFPLGILMTTSGSLVVIRICMLIDSARLNMLARPLAFAGVNSLLILCLHQVEGSFIAWPSIEFTSLASLSYIVVGILHIMLVCVVLWMVYLNPLSSHGDK